MPEVMTLEEVAAYLRVAEATVYRLIRAGQLPAVRIGRVWRVRRDLLEEWFAGQTHKPQTGAR